MARLWSSGAELNSVTAGVEITSVLGSPEVVTTAPRSGAYHYRINSGVNESVQYQFASSDQTAPYYTRFYFRIAAASTGTVDIVTAINSGSQIKAGIRLTSSNILQLWNREDSSQIGSDSAALSTGVWYRVELLVDPTTISATAVEGKIDGTTFASGTADINSGILAFRYGIQTNGDATADLYYDDIAINDSSGSVQNSWPGEGEIIHLRPNGNGDNSDFVGSDADSTDNYLLVNEVTPDDATTYVQAPNGATGTDDYNIDATPAALASDDTINCVQVGWRAREGPSSSGGSVTYVLRITHSGTTEEGSGVAWASTTWMTNHNAQPRNYNLTLYDLPGASTTAWTKSDLDAAQIGIRATNVTTNEPEVTAVWLLVDHKPTAGGGPAAPTATAYMTPNTLFWGI